MPKRLNNLTGVYTAVVTPFTRSQEIDYGWMAKHLIFQRDAGIDGVVLCGTNGEGQMLSFNERRSMLQKLCPKMGKLKVIVGAGFVSAAETVEFCRICEDYPVEAVLIMPPYFDRKAGLDGIAAWFEFLASRTKIPILLYHIPQLSGMPVSIELLAKLRDTVGICGVKDSSGDVENTKSVLKSFPELAVYCGSDHHLLESLKAGVRGAISGVANVFPAQVVDVYRKFRSGQDAAEAQQLVAALTDAVFEGLPQRASTKYALHLCGMPQSRVRPPEVELTKQQKMELTGRLQW